MPPYIKNIALLQKNNNGNKMSLASFKILNTLNTNDKMDYIYNKKGGK